MKKVQMVVCLILVLIGLVLVSPMVMAETRPRDVSTNDPAYKAVKTLVDKGYLQLYQDQTFQGDKPVDRFTLATLVARILDEIASGEIGTSKSDIALLRSLTSELHEELLELSSKGAVFDKKLEDLSRQDQVIKEDLTTSSASVQVLSSEQMELQKEAGQMLADIQGLQEKVKNLDEQHAQFQSQLDQAKAKLDQSAKELNLAKVEFNQKLKNLEDQNAQLKSELDQATAKLDQSNKELAQAKKEYSQATADLDQVKNANTILESKQRTQQTYLIAAIILAVAGIVIH